MTAKELIDKLSEFDPDMEVEYHDSGHAGEQYTLSIDSVEVNTDLGVIVLG